MVCSLVEVVGWTAQIRSGIPLLRYQWSNRLAYPAGRIAGLGLRISINCPFWSSGLSPGHPVRGILPPCLLLYTPFGCMGREKEQKENYFSLFYASIIGGVRFTYSFVITFEYPFYSIKSIEMKKGSILLVFMFHQRNWCCTASVLQNKTSNLLFIAPIIES